MTLVVSTLGATATIVVEPLGVGGVDGTGVVVVVVALVVVVVVAVMVVTASCSPLLLFTHARLSAGCRASSSGS